MRRMAISGVLALTLAAGCWRGAQPAGSSRPISAPTPSASPAEASYRHVTLALDAAGIGLLAASTFAYAHRGGDDALASGLAVAGGLSVLGSPIVHGVRGHGARAGASYLLRSVFVSAGAVVGMRVGCAGRPDWFCGLGPELGWGMVGGFVVAGALDAWLLHGTSSTWTPTVMPADDGARVGLAKTF